MGIFKAIKKFFSGEDLVSPTHVQETVSEEKVDVSVSVDDASKADDSVKDLVETLESIKSAAVAIEERLEEKVEKLTEDAIAGAKEVAAVIESGLEKIEGASTSSSVVSPFKKKRNV